MGLLSLMSTSLLLVLSCFLPQFCVADDRMLTGDSLPLNETLVSGRGTFALGFFTLGASPPRRYLGIWYNNLPGNRTVVWVANREKPFPAGSSVVLRISNDSNLEVTNSAGAVLWSTNTAGGGGGAAGRSMKAVLVDSGNLLLGTENTTIWQSFDDFGNTGLPGMAMLFDTTTGRGDRYLSWKSADDPAPGSFTFGIDPARVVQMIIWKDNRTFWRSIQGSPHDELVALFSIQGSPDTAVSITFTSGSIAYSTLQRIYLDHYGIIRILYWSNNSSQWRSLFSSNSSTTACDAYSACGPNGFCNNTASWTAPACNCLSGYEPRITSEWNRGNHSAGCAWPAGGNVRCDQNDVFKTVGGVKLPDKMVYLKQVTSARDCEGACRSNCSCTAYAHANATTTPGYFTARCFVWHGDLMDLVQYQPSSSGSGDSLQFRLLGGAPSAADKKEKAIFIPATVIAAAVVLAMLILIICLVWRYKKNTLTGFWRRRSKWKQLVVLLRYTSSGSVLSIKNGKEEAGEDVPLQNFELITSITNNFSDSNKLGEGGFGKVYKGVMPTGVEVAVKRLSRGSSQGQEEFKNEVALIAKLQHRNLVKLVGSCIHREERILIYEYVSNGSLSNFLFDSIKQVQLDWETRFNIIKGIARGMMYLHQDSSFKIVHRDLKASNILLDEDMKPKISDFGMARIFGGNQSRCITHRVVGTYGYMSPEYAMEGHYSVKSDVYSFGVLLLEIISGRRNNIFYHNEICLNLLTYAWHMWKEENVMDFLDSFIASTNSPVDQVSRCLHVGLLCVQDHVNKRPFMSSIVFMLENDTYIRDKPKRPMFMLEATQDGGEAPKSGRTCPSVNDLSITVVEGR